MSTKHTPGPWTTDIVQVGKEWLKGRLSEAVVAGDEVVAVCAENEANARLIAAAPTMLQALRLAKAAIEMDIEMAKLTGSDQILIDAHQATIDTINDTITSATGEQP